jgi:hypothetical protein
MVLKGELVSISDEHCTTSTAGPTYAWCTTVLLVPSSSQPVPIASHNLLFSASWYDTGANCCISTILCSFTCTSGGLQMQQYRRTQSINQCYTCSYEVQKAHATAAYIALTTLAECFVTLPWYLTRLCAACVPACLLVCLLQALCLSPAPGRAGIAAVAAVALRSPWPDDNRSSASYRPG